MAEQMTPPMQQDAVPGEEKAIERDPPEVPAGRAELVKEKCKAIEEAKAYWDATFKKMRAGAVFARGKQWPAQKEDDDRYIANVTLRHINQRVANIYAKNPKVRAQRRQKLYLQVWDGTPEMLQMAAATMQQAQLQQQAQAGGVVLPAMPATGMDPATAQAILTEAQEAQSKRKLFERMGKTLEIVAQYSLDEPVPKFKPQAKQLVRRVLTCGVGYLKLGYQRLMKYDSADVDARIKDATDRMAEIEALLADLQDKETQSEGKEAEELRLLIENLQKEKEVVLREGLVFSFPKAWSLVVDPAVTQLKGFVGAGWVAEEYILTPKQVQKFYKVDVGKSFEAHKATGSRGDKRFKDQRFCAVYQVYDLVALQCFTVCLGYPDFLKEPGDPDVVLEQFHPYYTLSFNDVEPDADDDNPYPPSDVDLIRPMQVEYNRGREGLRTHRQAQRPAHVVANGVFDDPTLQALSTHADHEVVKTNLSKNDDINKLLMAKPTIQIQPELYEVENVFIDTQRVVGDQAANLGGTSGSTATEVGIAENTRVTSIQSNIDDLDEFLTDVMRGAGQILLAEMSKTTVQEIAGPAAVWPEMPPTRKEVARELQLEIKAGSSGKPNRQARLNVLEKVGPLVMQTPGFKPRKWGEILLGEFDEGIDIDDVLDDSLPSMTAMNAMAKPNLAAGPGNDAQGPQGAMNAPAPAQSAGKTQNMNPAPGATPPPPGLTPS